jgi:hypothetical protein
MNAIETFLDSIRLSPPGGKWSFLWNQRFPGSIIGGTGFEFYVDFDKKTRSSLLLLKEHPELLKGLSILKVSNLLSNFFQSSIEVIGADELFFADDRNKTILQITPQSIVLKLNNSLERFLKDKLRNSIFGMPVNGIPCLAEKTIGELLWIPINNTLIKIVEELGIPENEIQSNTFPPLVGNNKFRKYPLTDEDSWFIVKAPDESVAESYFRRMTGALSVILNYPHSRMITDRQLIDGRFEFKPDETCSFNFKTSLVPAVSLPFKTIEKPEDLFWELCANNSSRRVHICLEYMADSWGKGRIISFINTSIAMDALFGVNGKVKKSILEGVENNCLNISSARNRYDLILKIRNDILHGECPTLEASTHYLNYYDEFNADPADDQIRIINDCLSNLAGVS